MWPEIRRYLPAFGSAVLTAMDGEGCPFSLRCNPQMDAGAGLLRITLPAGFPIRPGRAGLLFHRHDENLWNLLSFVLRGELARDGEHWVFLPEKFVPGMGIGGLIGYIRFVYRGRKAAKRFLKIRGLQRPEVAWDEWLAAFENVGPENQAGS